MRIPRTLMRNRLKQKVLSALQPRNNEQAGNTWSNYSKR
jgi:hypothetical protein